MPDKVIEIINYNGTEYEVGIQSLVDTSTKGLMSPADKVKLDGIEVSSIVGTSPIAASTTNGVTTISHNNSGVTAASKGDTSNQTPAFGGTFKVLSGTVNATGHVTVFSDHTVKIPNTLADTSHAGLMSTDDKDKLDSIARGAQVNTVTGVKGNSETSYRTGNINITKANIGLGNVENKSSETIRGELTSSNVTTALGFNPATRDIASTSAAGLMSADDRRIIDGLEVYSIQGTAPIAASATNGIATVSHNTSGVTANTYGTTATTALTPGFGSTFSVPGFTVNATGHVTAAGAHTVKIPNATATTDAAGLMSAADKAKIDGGLTIAGNSIAIGGSITADILRTSLGLSNAMHFIGIATVAITDGSTTNPTISGYTFGTNGANAQKGDVVIDKDSAYEFVWTGSKWERLGPDGSYALAGHTHNEATTTAAGFMSAGDKAKLDGMSVYSISGTAPISATNTSGTVSITHATSGPSASGNTSKGDTSNQTPGFGGTFKVTSETVDKFGHTTALAEHTVTIPNAAATTDAAGLMSAADKAKLDGVAANAKNTTISATTPIVASASTGAVTLTHATAGPSTTADTSKGDTSNQTPGWGGTFKVTSGTVDKYGHTKTFAEHTVTIPNAVATTDAAGLMSAADKARLDASAAANHNHDSVYVKKAGDTMSGYLTVGTTSQSAAPTAAITIHDTRNYTWTPAAITKGVNWYFTMNNSPNTSKWWSVMHLTGWTSDYNTWEVAGPSHNEDQRTAPLYVRAGRTTEGWGSWRKIYDTSNKPSLVTMTVGSASAGTAISADDITGWTTNTPTAVTKKTVVTSATFNSVVTGGSTTDIPNISKKTVVTSATAATASYSNGILTISNGSVTTGDSVTVGTAIKAYTSLTTGASGSATTGDSVTVTAGTAASLTYTSRSIPNISVVNATVATGEIS